MAKRTNPLPRRLPTLGEQDKLAEWSFEHKIDTLIVKSDDSHRRLV